MSFAFDLGSGRGIKAVLTILESEAVGSRDVQAVIGLPPVPGVMGELECRNPGFSGNYSGIPQSLDDKDRVRVGFSANSACFSTAPAATWGFSTAICRHRVPIRTLEI